MSEKRDLFFQSVKQFPPTSCKEDPSIVFKSNFWSNYIPISCSLNHTMRKHDAPSSPAYLQLWYHITTIWNLYLEYYCKCSFVIKFMVSLHHILFYNHYHSIPSNQLFSSRKSIYLIISFHNQEMLIRHSAYKHFVQYPTHTILQTVDHTNKMICQWFAALLNANLFISSH